MKFNKFFFAGVTALSLLASCGGGTYIPDPTVDPNPNPDEVAVQLTSSLTPMTEVTRVGDNWAGTESVGVFMLDAASDFTVESAGVNVEYTVGADGALTAAATKLVYPEDKDVKFIGYYPYASALTDSEISVDLTKDGEKDILISEVSATASAASDAVVNLAFRHLFTKANFVVKSQDGLTIDADKVAMTAYVSNTQATVSLKDNSYGLTADSDGQIALAVAGADGTATGSAVIFPGKTSTGANQSTISKVVITVNGTDFTYTPSDDAFAVEGNVVATFNMVLDTDTHEAVLEGATIDPWDQTVGGDDNPGGETPEAGTISALRAMYSGSDVSDFSSMPTVKGIVISDPTTGNVSSSQIIVSDGSKGIVLYSHDGYDSFSYKLGDEIEITLDGANLTVYKGQPELVVAAANLKVIASDKMLEPVAITPAQLVSGDYNCMYIKVSGVQVKAAFRGSAWSVGNAGFESESNDNFVVFTRDDATFKNELIPDGFGDLIGIYVYYDGTNEVILNSVDGAAGLTGERFIPEVPGGDPIPVDPVNPSELAYASCGEVPAIDGQVQIQNPVSETYGDGYAYSAKLVNNDNLTYVVHTTGTGASTLRSYSLLFDKTKRAALWVAYVMQNDAYPDNEAGRNEAWTYDPALPVADQANLNHSYAAVDGISYDRGHQLASNSRQVSKVQNQQTFYYSNMTPQVSTLNQGNWGALEQKEQGWDNLASTDTLFVVTGPVFGDNPMTTTDASGNACALPDGYYKVIVKASFLTPGNCNSVQGVGFYFPTTGWGDWTSSTMSIDEIEEKTGLDFFANLPSEYTTEAEKTTSYSFLQ